MTIPNYIDAFFEAMSGFTTTGATVIDDVEVLGYGILFWRSMTQWLGGMGIIALFVAVLPRLGGGSHFFRAEIPGPVKERIVPRIAQTAKILWLIYLIMSLLQVIFLLFSGLTVFESLTHTLTTMSTGGFSTWNLSIAAFNNPITEIVIIVFMLMAGINFSLYYSLYRGNLKSFIRDFELRFYLSFLLVMSLIVSVYLFIFHYGDVWQSLRYGIFQVVSIATTTGFVTADYDQWHPLLQNIIFFLQFTGGSGGSTSGSIKMIRLIVTYKVVFREIYRLIHPRAILPIRLGNKLISNEVVSNILAFVLLYTLIFILSSLAMTSMGIDMVSSFSAVAATLGNVGPGLNMVGPLNTYSFIPPAGKLLLSGLMLIGRLEIYTVMVLLITLFSRKSSPSILKK
ncbi:MAG: TrkH family potassium uptake protein [Candidatus Contubernalis sp.]|nr:TrkH family potassium uptake protein [Candidatus Contubernalis sp.]